MQTLNAQRKTCFWVSESPLISNTRSTSFNSTFTTFWNFSIDFATLQGPDLAPALPYWDSVLGITAIRNSFANLDVLVSFTALPEESDPIFTVAQSAQSLVAKINTLASTVPYVYRKCFQWNGSCKGLDSLQAHESVKKYGKLLARFICTLIRRAQSPEYYSNFPVIQETIDRTINFYESFETCLNADEKHVLIRDYVIDVFSEKVSQQCDCAAFNFARICSFQAGKTLNLNNTTQPIAMLKYGIKGCLLLKMIEMGNVDKALYEIAWPDSVRPFTFIHDASKLLTTCILNSNTEPHISKVEPFVEGLDQWYSVDGVKLNLLAIKNCYLAAFAKCVELFHEFVPCMPDLDWNVLANDDCLNNELGYSVVLNMSGSNEMVSEAIIQRLYQTDGVLNLGSTLALATKLERINNLLAFLVCLSSGQPCRGSEIGIVYN